MRKGSKANVFCRSLPKGIVRYRSANRCTRVRAQTVFDVPQDVRKDIE